MVQRSCFCLDISLNSTPAIELRRGYQTGHSEPATFGFGQGANRSYNQWLSSDGIASLSYMEINREDGSSDRMARITPGRGFSWSSVYESHDDSKIRFRLLPKP